MVDNASLNLSVKIGKGVPATGNWQPVSVKVWGDLACFTRPEMKVERVTYPVPTPSAARGILEAIFWKPEFSWRVQEIWVLRPIRYISILRNEVNSRISFTAAQRWVETAGAYFADEDRAQRHTVALRDVAYIIVADVHPRSGDPGDQAKYRDQFRRRVQRGQCFHRPYLGTREFAADFGPPDGSEVPIDHTEALGTMLFDLVYESNGSGRAIPRFFEAQLVRGVVKVPSELYGG